MNLHKNVVFPTVTVVSSIMDSEYTQPVPDSTDSIVEIPGPLKNTEEICPEHILKCQGLQSLLDIEDITVKRIIRSPQRMSLNEPSKYEITTRSGQLLFFAAERTEFFLKNSALFAKPASVEFSLMNPVGENVVQIVIEQGFPDNYKCCARQKEKIIGKVSQQRGCFTPYYLLEDSQNNEVMTVKVHDRTEDFFLCPMRKPNGCYASNFDILLPSGYHSVGTLQKKFTASKLINQYDISFSQSLEIGIKSLLIASAIMMDLEALPGMRERERKFDTKYFCSKFCIAVLCFVIPSILLMFIAYFIIEATRNTDKR